MATMIVNCIIARQWKKEGRDNTTLYVFDLDTAHELSISWPGEIPEKALASRVPVRLQFEGVEVRRSKDGNAYMICTNIGNADEGGKR